MTLQKLTKTPSLNSYDKLVIILTIGVALGFSSVATVLAASYDSYQSTQVTKVGQTSINVKGAKGDINVYTPSISTTSDHRDSIVYVFNSGKFTLGAGYYAKKSGSTVVKNELVYYYKDSSGFLSHYLHSPFTSSSCVEGKAFQISEGGSSWKGEVNTCAGSFIFSITVSPGTGATSASPGAVARAMSTSASGNTLPGHFKDLNIGYWSGGVLASQRIDSGVTVSDYKCASEDSWKYDKIFNYYEFKTGPGVATSDNCSSDNPVRVPPGE